MNQARQYSYNVGGVIASGTVLIPSADVDGLQGIVVHVTSMGTSGAIQVQQSNDNSNWVTVQMQNVGGGSPGGTLNASSVIYVGGLFAKFFRVVMATATTGGTTTFTVRTTFDAIQSAVIGLPALGGTSTVVATLATTTGPTFSIGLLPAAAASTNATLLKGSAARLAKVYGYNAAAAVRYLKLYNKATAPVPGTDTPILQIPLAPSAIFNFEAEDFGIPFGTGLGYALGTGSALLDATAVAANDIVGMNVLYI